MPAHTMDDATRFASKTQRDPKTGSLLWTAARLKDGYGVFSIRHRPVRATRWALEQHLGRPLRPGMMACHACDNPPCVEVGPGHLYEGTRMDNARDAVERGQTARGLRVAGAKLSDQQVAHMRELLAANQLPQRAIATLFEVHPCHVSRINSGLRRGR